MPPTKVTAIHPCARKPPLPRPLFLASVPAGFPSPAEDHIEKPLDLNDLLIKHPESTFYVRVRGESMVNAGIHDGDLLLVDRAVSPISGKVVIANLDGELTVKRIRLKNGQVTLESENPAFADRQIKKHDQFEVWGVVTAVVHLL